MPGAICAAGSRAPPSRTTIFRGAPSGAGTVAVVETVRLRCFAVPLAAPLRDELTLVEPVPVFSFAALSGAFFTAAGVVSAGASSAGAVGSAGACPAGLAEPAASWRRESIPAAGKLSQSAIAIPQASLMTVPTELFPTVTKNARRKRRGRGSGKKKRRKQSASSVAFLPHSPPTITASSSVVSWHLLLEPSLPLWPSSPIPCRRSESMHQQR